MVNIRTEYQVTLADLPHKAKGRVLSLSPEFTSHERQRLTDLGLIPGTAISVQKSSALGGLRAYSLRGTVLGLRHIQAQKIQIEPIT